MPHKLLRSKQQMSESMALAIVLTLAGGFQDAYSYNCRGNVFANAQTGNIVLLGQNIATGQWAECLHYLFPVLAFLGGVFVTEWVRHLYKERAGIHWRQIVLILEIILLAVAGILPQSFNVLSNVLMSFACAMQVNSFRKFRGVPSATTMCIGNMRSATECLCKYLITKQPELRKKSLHYYFIIFIFAVGAACGAILTGYIGEYAIWIPGALLFIGFLMMFVKEDLEPNPQFQQEMQKLHQEEEKAEQKLDEVLHELKNKTSKNEKP